MAAHRLFIPAIMVAVVLVTRAWAPAWTLPAEPARTADAANPLEFTQLVDAMQRMHKRVISARSTPERQALVDESRQIMSAGVVLMRTLRSGLPTTASGEFVSNVVTEGQAQRVRDFLHLMELLVQMRADQESVPQAEPTPALHSPLPRPHLAGASTAPVLG